MIKDVQTLTSEAIDRDLADVLQFMSPPTDGIVHVLTVRHRRGELREALALVGLLRRVMTPTELRRFDPDAVQSRIESDIARKDAGAGP